MLSSILLIGALIVGPLTPGQLKKVERLEKKLMAPCCYSQTIYDHMSNEAAQMRDEVMAMVEAGKSEQEIITYYRMKYGETILAVPDGRAGEVAYAVPVSIALVALLALAGVIRHSGRNRNQYAEFGNALPHRPDLEKYMAKVHQELSDSRL